MVGAVGWYSNHQNKCFAGFGVLGVIFGDFLKISTILFRDFFFPAAKILKGKKRGGGIQTKKIAKPLRVGKLSSKNLYMGMWYIHTLLHGHIKAAFQCTKCTALGMAEIGCMLAAADVNGCY